MFLQWVDILALNVVQSFFLWVGELFSAKKHFTRCNHLTSEHCRCRIGDKVLKMARIILSTCSYISLVKLLLSCEKKPGSMHNLFNHPWDGPFFIGSEGLDNFPPKIFLHRKKKTAGKKLSKCFLLIRSFVVCKRKSAQAVAHWKKIMHSLMAKKTSLALENCSTLSKE